MLLEGNLQSYYFSVSFHILIIIVIILVIIFIIIIIVRIVETVYVSGQQSCHTMSESDSLSILQCY